MQQEGYGRSVPRVAIMGAPVYHPQHGWVYIDDSPPPPASGMTSERPGEADSKGPPTAPLLVVRSKDEAVTNYLPDTTGRTQIFIQKEEDGEVDYIYCRQFNLRTALVDFETYKRVTGDETESAPVAPIAQPLAPAIPEGFLDILLSAADNFNAKLDSINDGIKAMKSVDPKEMANISKTMSEVLKGMKELKKDV